MFLCQYKLSLHCRYIFQLFVIFGTARFSLNFANLLISGNTKVKLFITQGGLQSIEEAILSNVPLIGIPFIADQVSNIKKIVQSGVGVYLNKNEITKPKLKELINMVIKNPK